MQNGTISLKVTPYVGTYDGQEHNALSDISVEPNDAKLEYSLDGENYVTEMPKIKDTSEFTVTVVASKEGYKTVSTTETINYTSKTATYETTVNNGSIDLRVTPYTETYDGRQHNAVTVNVTPSDAKIEYSINGGTYSTTMPTVINTSSFTVTVQASKAGYKTQSTTQTVKVNKANGNLSLSSYSGTIRYPNSTSFTASGTGSISAWSSNTGVATVSVSGNTVTVKSIGAGSATITVKSASNTNYNEKTVAYAVNVKIQTFTESSGVGYYADVDGNGTVDGIIFADFKNGGSGSWGGTSYTISTATGLKEYYVSKTNYNGPFGTKNVLSARGSGNARFNVMALSDYNNSTKYIGTYITSGEWHTPTIETWTMFAGQLGITTSNYSGYGLKETYWSNSYYYQFDLYKYIIVFREGLISDDNKNNQHYIRLTRTF